MLLSAEVDMEQFFQKVETKSQLRDYVKYEERMLISHKQYQKLKPKDREPFFNHYVMFKGRPADFRRWSEYGGVTLYTQEKYYLEFYIRYHDHIMALQGNKYFYAICYLPKYNHCELLGKEYN